jgi:hypothetical protein
VKWRGGNGVTWRQLKNRRGEWRRRHRQIESIGMAAVAVAFSPIGNILFFFFC